MFLGLLLGSTLLIVRKPISRSILALFLAIGWVNVAPTPAFAATTYAFTNAAATGSAGPTQAQITTAYTGTTLAGGVTISTQGVQQWTVPSTGSYSFEVVGAHGAASTGASNTRGGRSVKITATKTLTSGTVLYIVVGQAGQADGAHGGGGGASFVNVGSRDATTNLLVAGGGGGTRTGASANGGDASTTTSGMSPGAGYNSGSVTTFYANTSANNFTSGSSFLRGSSSNAYTDVGYGGQGAGSGYGDGGAGWLGDGYEDGSGSTTTAKKLSATAVGGAGGNTQGGFGGGGNGAGSNGGGGGGGYTGGNGGWVAGGGGSYNSGFNSVTTAIDSTRSFNRSGTPVHGYVTITALKGTPTISISLPGGGTSATYNAPVTITATTSQEGSVLFSAGGSSISGCSSVATSSGSATCSWTPASVGSISLAATITPTDSANYESATSSGLSISVVNGSTTISIALAGGVTTATKSTPILITATISQAGKVTFYWRNKRISGCVNKTGSVTATCSWKPSVRGDNLISAELDPTSGLYLNSTSAPLNVFVTTRTSPR